MTAIEGVAHRSKVSAVILEAGGRVVHLSGLTDWPSGVDGLQVRAEGTLTREARLPRVPLNDGGLMVQGVAADSAPEWWLDKPVWSLVHKGPQALPWTLSVADGSGNRSVISRTAQSRTATWTYTPVTPENSSSGTYSGGTAAQGELSAPDAAILWATVRALQADTEHHSARREMGTTEIKEHSTESQHTVLLRRGAAAALHKLLSDLRTPDQIK